MTPFRFMRDLSQLRSVQHAVLYYSETDDKYLVAGERNGRPFEMTWDGVIFRCKYPEVAGLQEGRAEQ